MKAPQTIIFASLSLCLLANSAMAGANEDTAEGKRLAQINCGKCHALESSGASPLEAAPPFRDIAVNYDAGELEDAFNDGIVATHPAMPDWKMTGDQARELAAYIMGFAK